MSKEKNMILVTGATGAVGRQVVSQLLGAPARAFHQWAIDHDEDFREGSA